ncbi:MAG: hypothetical protein IPG22_18960 [Acidobacteria bacterium]|nr:hypothetical protein [Acidobacteriota bacterium]
MARDSRGICSVRPPRRAAIMGSRALLQVSRRRGRPKAKVAAARKLLINCYVMLRDNISYEQFATGGAKLACARGQER